MGPGSGLSVRRTTDGRAWVFVHPRCARDRAEDIAEVRAMVEAGELEVAVDELRWLVGGCSEFIEAHAMLGELALAIENDLALARGHFGFAVTLGLKTLKRQKVKGPLPYNQPPNKSFYEAGHGLVGCLVKLGMIEKAEDLVREIIALDRSDPLKLRALVDELRTDGLPIVDLTIKPIDNPEL
jgi:pentatricopeptide repeat protein